MVVQGDGSVIGTIGGGSMELKAIQDALDALTTGQPRLVQCHLISKTPDSLGLCLFGRSVTDTHTDFLANTINNALGTDLKQSFFLELGSKVLKLEAAFNKAAGFTAEDDELPAFFYDEPLHPFNKVARFHGHEVHNIYEKLEA